MRRSVGTVVATLVLLSSVAGVAVVVDAAQTDIAIRSVNTSVSQPAPDEAFTLSVEVANLPNSSGPVQITDVYVRSGRTEYARAEDLGSVSAGGSLTVPLSVEIDEAGRQRLSVYAVVRDADGDYTRVSYPLYVNVQEPDEAVVAFADLDPVAGERSTVNVTVANGDAGTLSNVRLELGGDATVENPERVNASLRAGTQTTYTYRVTFPETGEQSLAATLRYKTSEGATRTVEFGTTTDVEAANVDADLTAKATEVNGSPVIRASLTEYGNVELRDVQLRAVVDGETVARALLADVSEAGTRTATLDGSAVPAGEVTLVAEYTAAGEAGTTNTTLDYAPREASNVTLTGVEVAGTGSTLSLSGDVANLGSADADSVLLSVADGESVGPTAPNGEYFVGTIESSEFATFELTARADPNASVESVPVRISYSADGERVSRVVEVDASDASGSVGGSGAPTGPDGAAGPGGPTGSGGFPLSAIGVVLLVVVVAVVGVGVYRWRRR